MKHKKTNIVLLFGGRSAEHEVSLISATSIYKNLDKKKFEIKNDKRDKYEVLASYAFQVANKTFDNKKTFENFFLNTLSAKSYVESLSKKDFMVWYNSKNPNISYIEKKFPVKNCVYASLAFVIFIYFLILKYYMFGFQKIE